LGTKLLTHQGVVIWFIVRRWEWKADMGGALMVDKMELA
jgi:hypothetical protein